MQEGIEERYFVSESNSASFKIFVHEYSSPLHWHKYLEILYILEGRVLVSINGKERIVEPGILTQRRSIIQILSTMRSIKSYVFNLMRIFCIHWAGLDMR